MRRTIFSTPVITPILRFLSIITLKLMGWKSVGEEVHQSRLVLIAAPHTSNWDFPIMIMVVLKLRLQVFWMGKSSLFPYSLGWFVKWLGGIPIDRSMAHNVVDQTVARFNENENLVVLIPPEGTRSRVKRWKSGFYHIANNAQVPILLGYIDAVKKEAGLADFFQPTGNLESDMEKIRDFYKAKTGINPENA